MSLALSALAIVTSSCGGSGSAGQGGSGQQTSPDFTLSLSSSSLTIASNSKATITATVTGSNGFTSKVSLQISGLPSGVTFSPTSLEVTPGTPLQIVFTAASSVTSSTAALTITGSSGSLKHNAQVSLAVTTGPLTFRTRYTRTDAATGYSATSSPQWIVFDQPTNRFFVCDPGGNRVEVVDPAKEAMVSSIAVPGAYAIDETPDHSTLYVATQVGDVYSISLATLKITNRYMASKIGPSGYQAFEVHVLANGNLALLGGQGGIPSVDGYYSIALWNPATNALIVHNDSHIQNFTVTGDRTLVVFTSLLAVNGFCTLTADNASVACANPSSSSGISSVVATPDGKSLLWTVPSTGQIAVYDPHTLTQTGIFAVSGDAAAPVSMAVSPDSQTLYLGGSGIVYAYNIANGTQVGWTPTLIVESTVAGAIQNPNLQAIDGTGLLAGPMEEGVGFVDTATLQTGPIGTGYSNDYLTPATGPAGGGTSVQFEDVAQTDTITAAYLGGNPATSVSQAGGGFYLTTPAGSEGPADLYALMNDGAMLIVPEAFSYGPTVLAVRPNTVTSEGGGTGIVYGYGFGPTAFNSPIPTDLQIMIGGKSVSPTGFAANAYISGSPPPFNLQAATFTIPPGAAGSSTDLVVTTPSGSATASGALQYISATQQFGLFGAQLAQGIYDAKRDLYYFTDASQIRVFSRTQGQWLASMQVPAAPTGTTHRLWGIALSHDGSKLAVSDASAGMIYLINPDAPGNVQTFPFNVPYIRGSPIYGQAVITNPAGVAISDSGMIYLTAFTIGGTGYDGFFKIDSNSGDVTDYGVENNPGIGPLGGAQYRGAITPDNSTVFFNDDGDVFSVDTATDAVFHASLAPGCCYGDYDLALNAEQTTLSATGYLYDTNLNAESYLVLNVRDALNTTYVYGTKLSPDGTLLFQPSTNGIDVFDGRLGTLRQRISLPFALSQNFDALVSDGTDNVLVAITGQTGNGIAVVDLSSLAAPAPLAYVHSGTSSRPSRRETSAGSQTRRQILPAGVKHVTSDLVPYRRKP